MEHTFRAYLTDWALLLDVLEKLVVKMKERSRKTQLCPLKKKILHDYGKNMLHVICKVNTQVHIERDLATSLLLDSFLKKLLTISSFN